VELKTLKEVIGLVQYGKIIGYTTYMKEKKTSVTRHIVFRNIVSRLWYVFRGESLRSVQKITADLNDSCSRFTAALVTESLRIT
jgi:hypothetical protein